MSRQDVTGQRWNHLVALSFVDIVDSHTPRWLFLCDCGAETAVRLPHVKSGNTKSCGCYGSRLRFELGSRALKHGHRGLAGASRTYQSWAHMVQRCMNSKAHEYPYYGGRGITVCERWMDFGLFLNDMGDRPLGMSIDRFPDVNGNYEPGNCRWATTSEQARNKRTSKLDADLVREIHGRSEHGESRRSISDRMGLTLENVRSVLTGKSWKEFMPSVADGVA